VLGRSYFIEQDTIYQFRH